MSTTYPGDDVHQAQIKKGVWGWEIDHREYKNRDWCGREIIERIKTGIGCEKVSVCVK